MKAILKNFYSIGIKINISIDIEHFDHLFHAEPQVRLQRFKHTIVTIARRFRKYLDDLCTFTAFT